MVHKQLTALAATMTALAMGLGAALVLADCRIVAANISVVRRGLQLSSSTTSFVAVVTILTMAAAAFAAGALGARYGMRRMHLAGACGAIGFGCLAAAAPNVIALVIARAGSGVSFAFLMGLSLAIINAAFPPDRRARAIALYLAFYTGFAVLPPTLGSLLIEHFGWRAGFLVAPALATVVVVLTLRFVPDVPRSDRKLDIPGMVLVAVALLALIYGISRMQSGFNAVPVMSIVVGILAGAGFVMWERHTDAPTLDLRLFRSARFNAAVAAGAAINLAAGGSTVVLVYYLVIIRAEPTATFALLLIPAMLLAALASLAAGRAAARLGEPTVLVAGLAVLLSALLMQRLLDLNTPLILLVLLVAAKEVGAAIAVVPQATIMMSSAPTELGGVVSAVRSSVASTAYSLGAALFSLVGVALGLHEGKEKFAGTGVTAEQARDALRIAHAGASPAGGPGTSVTDPEQLRWVVPRAAEVMIDDIHTLSLIMAVVPTIAIVVALVLLRQKANHRG